MILFPDGRPSGRTTTVLLWVLVAFLLLGLTAFALADAPAQPSLPKCAEIEPPSYPNPVLRTFSSGSELAVAVSTLATLALVQPLPRRTQKAFDRRFYLSRYDAACTLDAFNVRLRDQVDLDAVRGGLLDVVHDTVEPSQASLWLRR